MLKIKLNSKKYQDIYTIIDNEDFNKINIYNWFVHKESGRKGTNRFVAETRIKGKNIKLHRFLLNAKPGQIVDHINGNSLDNRKENLRICTVRENAINSNIPRGKSKYKGVDFVKRINRWRTRIKTSNKRITLGYFTDEDEAARAYNQAAIKYFGTYARLNDI